MSLKYIKGMKGKKLKSTIVTGSENQPCGTPPLETGSSMFSLSELYFHTNMMYGLNCNYCWQTQTDREFHNFGHTTPPFQSRPEATRWLLEIHRGREQTKRFPQRQNKTLWLQQWPHNRPSSNGPFAFRWKERNKVIWTCGPSAGAAVKHLTRKQLNCAAAVSLSGKLIQRTVRMIPFIRDEKATRLARVFTFQAKATLGPRYRQSNRRGKNKESVGTSHEEMSVFAGTLCSAIVSDGLTFLILQRGQSSGFGFHFFCHFSHFTLLLPCSRWQDWKKAMVDLTASSRYEILWRTDEPNKEQMRRQSKTFTGSV